MTDTDRKEQTRADWPERWARGDLYKHIAADAGISESSVGNWFRDRGFSRYPAAEAEPYAQYPPAARALILFYAEGSDQRRWMEARVARWWEGQGQR